MASWALDYGTRGSVDGIHNFYEQGSYEFLLTATGVPVYLKEANWTFQGMYGAVELPGDMPVIAFPVGIDEIVAHQISAPEPSTFVLMLAAMALYAVRRLLHA